jgi:hypothetical protein
VDPSRIDPKERVREVQNIKPPRRPLVVRDRTIADETTTYHLVRWRPEYNLGGAGATILQKSFRVAGDHIYVAEMNAHQPVYIRIGPATNPYIRIMRRMMLRRKFSQFSLKFAGAVSPVGNRPNVFPDVTLYVSTGPLIDHPNAEIGIDANLYASSDNVVTTTPTFLYNVLGVINPSTLGKMGGEITIQNIDLVNDIYIGCIDPSADLGAGFRIVPGQTVSLKLAGRLAVNVPGLGTTGLYLYTLSGSAAVSLMASPQESDTWDLALGPDAGGIAS